MKDIHSACMLLVNDHIHEFIEQIPYNLKQPFLYRNNDEVIIAFDEEMNYGELLSVIDGHYFRMQIFELSFKEDHKYSWYIETYDNDVQKIKAKQEKKVI